MSELLEPIAVATVHDEDPKCPFCPGQGEEEDFKTYGGAANNSTVLGKVMARPADLTSEQSAARPQDGAIRGKFRNQAPYDEKPAAELRKDRGDPRGYFSLQAHHAIPGKQALAGHAVETYIKKGDKLVRDTGYSVNNVANGIWLPSYPDRFRGQWADRDGKKKQTTANNAMRKYRLQFHCGHHDVDPDGIDRRTNKNYVHYVKARLDTMANALQRWEDKCPNESPRSDRHYGNILIHNALDHLSQRIMRMVAGTPRRWRIFVSRYALNYKRRIDTY